MKAMTSGLTDVGLGAIINLDGNANASEELSMLLGDGAVCLDALARGM